MSAIVVECDRGDPVLSFAAEELARWLPLATGERVEGARSAVSSASRIVLRVADDGERARYGFSGAAEEYHVEASGDGLLLLGQDAKGVLDGVYAWLEARGFLFDLGGVRAPSAPAPAPGTALHGRPSLRRRGIRMHMNFPMDQSAWSLADVREYVDNVARMRLNYLVLHVYPMLAWLDWEFLGVRDRSGELFSDEIYPVPDVDGVRERVGNRVIFYPPEAEALAGDRDAVYRHGENRFSDIIAHAHRRGIRVGVALEVLPFTPGFLEEVKRRLRIRTFSRGQYLAMVRARFRAMLAAFRDADEFHCATMETGNLLLPGTEADAELERMGRRYGLPEAWLVMVRKKGRANPEFPRIVASMLQTTELSRELFAEAGVASPVLMVYDALPDNMNAVAEVVGRVWKPFEEVHLLTDYGAYSVTKAMPAWEPFAASMRIGLVTWIQFDGLMYLLQNSLRSFSRGIDLAMRYGIDTAYYNHWSISGLEVLSAFAAAKMWDAGLDPDRFYAAHLGRRWGLERVEEAVEAFDAIEELTEYCTDNLFNIGFSCPGWVTSKADCDIRRGWTVERLEAAMERCRRIASMLEALLPKAAASAGRAHVALLANRIECSLLHLEACRRMVQWRDAAAADRPRIRDEHGEYARAYLRHYARFVLDRSDEGMLASYFRVIARNEHVLHPDDAAGG